MDRTRKIIGSLVLAAMAATTVQADSIQVPLKDDSWVLVGVPGYHTLGLFGNADGDPNDLFVTTGDFVVGDTVNDGTDHSTNNVVLTDDVNNKILGGTSTDAPTWDANSTGHFGPAINSVYTASPYSALGSRDFDAGVPIEASLGLSVIGDSALAGVAIASINYKYIQKNQTSSMRVMYIKSSNASGPDVKIVYQAFYEGQTFYMRFDSSETTFQGTFNKDNTYNAPVTLSLATTAGGASDSGTAFQSISTIIDMSLGDNNYTQGSGFNALNFLNPGDPQAQVFSSAQGTAVSGITAGATIGSFTSLEGNFTAFNWDSSLQEWRFFQLTGDANTLNAASDFTTVEAGKAYWMKIQVDSGTSNFASSNREAPGILLGNDKLNTDAEKVAAYTSQVNKGWNLMAFDDDVIRYSMTGLRVQAITATQIIQDINLTDATGAHTLSIPAGSSTVGGSAHAVRWCMNFNKAVEDNNTYGFTNFDVKCFAGDGNTSLNFIGTKQFTIQTPFNWAGQVFDINTDTTTLTPDTNGTVGTAFYTSSYGMYGLVFEPNPDWTFMGGENINGGELSAGLAGAKMSIACPDVNSTPLNTVDINSTVAGLAGTLSDIRNEVNTSLKAVAHGGTTTALDQQDTSRAGSLDLDSDGIDDAILMASSTRFNIRDHTFMRVFTYNPVASPSAANSLRIEGAGTQSTEWLADDVTTSKLARSMNLINDTNATTGVYARSIDVVAGNDANDTIMFWSTQTPTFDIKENGTVDRLTDKASDTNQSTKGAVEKVWYISAIAGYNDGISFGHYHSDGNFSATTGSATGGATDVAIGASVSDLKYNRVWAEDFPSEGPLHTFRTLLSTGADKYAAEVFITADTQVSIGTGITNDRNASLFTSWQTIDVTRDPSTWYNTTDQFNLFWTEQNKGYWVYVDDGVANPVAITVGASPITGTVAHHYDNTVATATSAAPVHNHFVKTLTISVAGILGTSDSTALATTDNSYEVTATIGGNKVPMFNSTGTNFTIDLSEYETNGLVSGSTYDVTLIASDGLGNKGAASVSVDYTPPTTPTVTDNGDGTFTIVSSGANYIQIHESNISDVTPSVTLASYSTDSDITAVNAGNYSISFASISSTTFPTVVDSTKVAADVTTALSTSAATAANMITLGFLGDLRIIGADGEVSGTGTIGRDDTNSLFSDMFQTFFAPATSSAHVLAGLVANASSSTPYDSFPAVMNADGSYSGTTLTLNSGVQIKADASGVDVTMSYLPITGANVDQGVPGQLTIPGICTIIWNTNYDGRAFFLSFNSKLYAGYFSETINTLTEITDLSGFTSQTITKP
jgi:hypothetical protein